MLDKLRRALAPQSAPRTYDVSSFVQMAKESRVSAIKQGREADREIRRMADTSTRLHDWSLQDRLVDPQKERTR